MAESVRLQQTRQDRGHHGQVQRRDRRWAALTHGSASGDRGRGCRPRPQPHAGSGTPGVRPHRMTPERGRGECAASIGPCNTAAQLSVLMTYRTAAEVLAQLFPVDAGADPETLRRYTFKTAEALPMRAETKPPPTRAEAIVVTLDSTFIRSCGAGLDPIHPCMQLSKHGYLRTSNR